MIPKHQKQPSFITTNQPKKDHLPLRRQFSSMYSMYSSLDVSAFRDAILESKGWGWYPRIQRCRNPCGWLLVAGGGPHPKLQSPYFLGFCTARYVFFHKMPNLSHPKHHENNTEAEASIVIYFYEVTILGPLLASSNYSKRTLWITRIFPPFDKNQHNYWWIWTTPGLVLLLPEMPAAAKSSNMDSPVQKKTGYLHGGNFMLVPMTYLAPGSNLHGALAWLFA